MPPLQPDQASLLLQMSLATISNEHSVTRRVIESIPLDKGDFRPDPVSKTSLDLAWHIVNSERHFFQAVEAGEFEKVPFPMPASIKNSADLSAWYEEMYATHFAALSRLTGEQLAKTVDFLGIFQLPAVTYLQFAQNHSIHHRGQLSMYLRPMGAKVPPIYGDSYDSKQQRGASA